MAHRGRRLAHKPSSPRSKRFRFLTGWNPFYTTRAWHATPPRQLMAQPSGSAEGALRRIDRAWPKPHRLKACATSLRPAKRFHAPRQFLRHLLGEGSGGASRGPGLVGAVAPGLQNVPVVEWSSRTTAQEGALNFLVRSAFREPSRSTRRAITLTVAWIVSGCRNVRRYSDNLIFPI
jgi:hypothetical protein